MMTNEQQRIVYLEKLLDDATGAMALLRKENERQAAKISALVAENAGLKGVLEYVINPDNEPEYHDQGMGCGVEDRGLQRDGYAACSYGWDSAMERVYSEVIPDALPETPATDAAIAAIRAEGVEMFAEDMAMRHAKCQSGGFFDRQVVIYGKASDLAKSFARQLRHNKLRQEGAQK